MQSLALADFIDRNSSAIIDLLLESESYETVFDQLERTTQCLRNSSFASQYFSYGVPRVASFLPQNLPLYSLLLFGIHPALMGSTVSIRPPVALQTLHANLAKLLLLDSFGLHVELHCCTREDFVRNIVAASDVVLFTGRLPNANEVYKRTRSSSLFLFNGRGVNPCVIAPGSNVDEVAKSVVRVKLFNSGQDCASPDLIVVHKTLIDGFILSVQQILSEVRCGNYADDVLVRVGPLIDKDGAIRTATKLSRSHGKVIYGGNVDVRRNTVTPTVLLYPSLSDVSFEEFFSPVFPIVAYETDSDLKQLFECNEYLSESMYVTLFGESGYIRSQDHSIVLDNRTILDFEAGHLPYGGNSLGASFVGVNRSRTARPILIPHEIKAAIDAGVVPCRSNLVPAPGEIDYILPPGFYEEFKGFLEETYGDNLVFAFIFGGVAKRYANSDHDIDVFICVEVDDSGKRTAIKAWLEALHNRLGFMFDRNHPCEIVTTARLDAMLNQLPKIILQLQGNGRDTFDEISWTQILADAKVCITGDRLKLHRYETLCAPWPDRWKQRAKELLGPTVSLAHSYRDSLHFLRKVYAFEIGEAGG